MTPACRSSCSFSSLPFSFRVWPKPNRASRTRGPGQPEPPGLHPYVHRLLHRLGYDSGVGGIHRPATGTG